MTASIDQPSAPSYIQGGYPSLSCEPQNNSNFTTLQSIFNGLRQEKIDVAAAYKEVDARNVTLENNIVALQKGLNELQGKSTIEIPVKVAIGVGAAVVGVFALLSIELYNLNSCCRCHCSRW